MSLTSLLRVCVPVLTVAGVLNPPAFAQSPAAEVAMLVGEGTALQPDGKIRELAKGSPVYSGEMVVTGGNSFLNLKFTDTGLILLRPFSRLQIQQYSYRQTTATGLTAAAPAEFSIAGVSPNPMPRKTGKQLLTVDGRGFKPGAVLVLFDVTHNRQFPVRAPNSQDTTRIEEKFNFGDVAAHWRVKVRNRDGTESAPYDFGVGMPVATPPAAAATAPSLAAATSQPQAGKGTATLNAEGQNLPSVSRAFFRLVRGGLRTVTGLVGRENHNEYGMTTPIATIGIRGTDYEAVICDAACALDPVVRASMPPGADGEGALIAGVNEGSIHVVPAASGCKPAGNGSGQGQTDQSQCPPAEAAGADIGPGKYLITLGTNEQRWLSREPAFLSKDPTPDPKACAK